MARVLLCHAPEETLPILDISLSERNLIVLLGKLYTPGSRCEFHNGDVPEGFSYARFRSEPDELHYASPTRDGGPPGPMHPLAEFVHAAVKELLDTALIAGAEGGEPNVVDILQGLARR
jgi:hypothetical protein